jgi:peptide/nickel transport system substrate-binding protein
VSHQPIRGSYDGMLCPTRTTGFPLRAQVLVTVSLALVLAGCAPGAPGPGAMPGGSDGVTSATKTLRMGIVNDEEPTVGISLFAGSNSTGEPEHGFMLHAGLTVYDADGNLQPRVAQKVPQVADGDWTVFPDGSMEVTWQLRSNVKWHDGTPLTAEDYVFGMQVALDNEIPHPRDREMRLISDVRALDDHTLVVTWRGPFMLANESGPVAPLLALPRHLVGELYRQDKQSFINSPHWTREFIGLGPYRLADWTLGSQMDLVAFDDFFLGKPKIDRVLVRYFGDGNTLMVNLLSGDLDMTPMGSLKPEAVQALQSNWEPTNAGSVLAVPSGSRNLRFQFRNPAAPWVQDRRVREAIYHMLDRETLAKTLQYGLTGVADTIPAPGDPVYRLVEQRGLVKYEFDLGKAQRLMQEAGWTRGADGVYRSASAEPFTFSVLSSDKAGNVEEGQAVAGQFRQAGLISNGSTFSSTQEGRDEVRATFQGALAWPLKFEPTVLQRFIGSDIPTAQTRWKGSNYGAYSNPVFDRLYDRYLGSLEQSERQNVLADLLKVEADDLASMHLYYNISTNTVAFRKGVSGVGTSPAFHLITTWNIHQWDVS